MNNKTTVIERDKAIVESATLEAREKIEALRDEFENWIWTDETRKKDLLKTYNEKFNSEVLRTYDGSHLNPNELRQWK